MCLWYAALTTKMMSRDQTQHRTSEQQIRELLTTLNYHFSFCVLFLACGIASEWPMSESYPLQPLGPQQVWCPGKLPLGRLNLFLGRWRSPSLQGNPEKHISSVQDGNSLLKPGELSGELGSIIMLCTNLAEVESILKRVVDNRSHPINTAQITQMNHSISDVVQ